MQYEPEQTSAPTDALLQANHMIYEIKKIYKQSKDLLRLYEAYNKALVWHQKQGNVVNSETFNYKKKITIMPKPM